MKTYKESAFLSAEPTLNAEMWQLLLLLSSWASLPALPVTSNLSVSSKLQKVEGAGQKQLAVPGCGKW